MQPLLKGEVELYRNVQWVVTSKGIDLVEGSYWIAKDRLKGGPDWNNRAAEFTFIQHMAGKGWVDIEAFIEAYLVACVVFGVKIPSIAWAIGWARRKVAYSRKYKAVEAELFPGEEGKTKLWSMRELNERYEAVTAELARRGEKPWTEKVGVVVSAKIKETVDG